VCDRVLPRINIAIHATRSALLLDGRIVGAYGITLREAREWADRSFGENPRWTNRDESDQVFPLRLPLGNATSAAAWLVLGPRPDGTLYGREDLDAVRSTLPSLHNALIATKARQILDAAIDRREKHLRTEIRKIYERLTELEGSRT
jgi:hypothetical protein